MKRPIIIGSRGSELALWQAHFIQDELKKIGVETELKIIKTQGDKIQNLSFDKLEGKGFFTKEIEDALVASEIDLAVHSHKDLPTTSPDGLTIAAVSYREDASELLLINKTAVDQKQKFSLKKNAIVGTSSARRKSQMLAYRSDITIHELRGNVPTRVNKLRDGQYDAILVAAAGVERLDLDLEDLHIEKISPYELIPAPAQGVLALQVRENDKELIELLQKINHADVQETIAIERKVLNLFDGGCQLPLGVYCEKDEELFKVRVSKSKAWDTMPVFMYFESKNNAGLAEQIVKKIENVKPFSVFISRNQYKHDLFQKVLTAHGFSVTAQSLIEIKKIPFKYFEKADWVFFASKHAVRHFMEQNPDVENSKFGAVGKETAAELRKFGRRADFIGYSTDTKLTGKQFAAVVKSSKVLFPMAKGSMRSIQQQFNEKQVIDLPVYETIKTNETLIPEADCYVFTSPSNVEAFFEKNKISSDKKIIAMGGATAAALLNFGIKRSKMPASFDDMGLIQAVFSFS